MFKFLTFFFLFSAQSASEFFRVRPREKCLLSSFSTLLHLLCNGAYSLFVSGKPFAQQNCMIGFVFIAGKEADCWLLAGTTAVRVSHCRAETACIAFLAKKVRNLESHSQIRINCRLVYSLVVVFSFISVVLLYEHYLSYLLFILNAIIYILLYFHLFWNNGVHSAREW